MNLLQVVSYDGQFIKTSSSTYELGTYLGGGASGVVYEATFSQQRVAVKILHPLGFKTNTPAALSRFVDLPAGAVKSKNSEFRWMHHPITKEVAVCSAQDGKELNLVQCTKLFSHCNEEDDDMPPKYAKYLKQRDLLLREISCMQRAAGHANVLTCYEALEYVQDNKSTFFLVLELAEGGELFDRISDNDKLNSEPDAKKYFTQLLSGVLHLHSRGVCHRDLKPENLLLDINDILKIADFGLSNVLESQDISPPIKLERFSSVVGSSHYTAPEILNRQPYDGQKSDSWSLGVILYALLFGSLPFGKVLQTCPRFVAFCEEIDNENKKLDWFLPNPEISSEAVRLLLGLLHPDPVRRYSVKQASEDVWLQVAVEVVAVDDAMSLCSSPSRSLLLARRSSSSFRSTPSFQSPPLAPLSSSSAKPEMQFISLNDEEPNKPAPSMSSSSTRRLSLHRARSTSPTTTRAKHPRVFLQHTRRSTRFTTATPAPETLREIERIVLESGLCSRVEVEDEFKMHLYQQQDDKAELGTVQVFLSRKRTRAMYIVEFVRAQNVEIFDFKLFYRDLFPLLKPVLHPQQVE